MKLDIRLSKKKEFVMECGRIRKHNFKKYYSKRYKVKTFGLVVPLLDGTVDFEGEDRKYYNTTKDDLALIEEEDEV